MIQHQQTAMTATTKPIRPGEMALRQPVGELRVMRGPMLVGAVGFAMCARRYASGAAESAAISARAAATSSLLVWA